MSLPGVHREGKTACWGLHNLEPREPGRSATLQLPPPCRHHGRSQSSKAEPVICLYKPVGISKWGIFKQHLSKRPRKLTEKEEQPVLPRGD